MTEAFDTCDMNRDGLISKYEIRDLMESKGVYVNSQELETLVEKFDKTKDGRITYSEFMDEMIPKSPSKAF